MLQQHCWLIRLGRRYWIRLATANAYNGAYRVRYLAGQPAVLHVRIALPDGSYFLGFTRVTPSVASA
jgi:hypothetical protein